MTMLDNKEIIRRACKIAEDKDIQAGSPRSRDDGTFTDESIQVVYRGPDELGKTVVNYATAFPDMHREIYQMYAGGENIVVVQLALEGTHLGPLHLPRGIIPATGKRMNAPCCDVFELSGDREGKLGSAGSMLARDPDGNLLEFVEGQPPSTAPTRKDNQL